MIPPGVSGPIGLYTVPTKLVAVNDGAPVDDVLGVSTRREVMNLCISDSDMYDAKAWSNVGSFYPAPPVYELPIGRVVPP